MTALGILPVPSKPSPHRRCLLKLSKALELQDINELLYLSEEFIPQTEVGAIKSGVDLMRSLEKHGRLGPGNYGYLASCLTEIGRIDLAQELELSLVLRMDGQLHSSHLLHWKSKAIQDKKRHFFKKQEELRKLTQDSVFWDSWVRDTLHRLSTQLAPTNGLLQQRPLVVAHNTNQTLKAATKLISGAIQHSLSFIAELERHETKPPPLTNMHLLDRLEEDLSTTLSISPMHCGPLSTQVEPLLRLKEQHPLSVVATKLFASLSDLLKELCGEAEAKKQLKETEESLAAVKSLLHTNAYLCFGFLTLVHITDTVASSEDDVLDQEAKEIIASLVHGFPHGAILTVVKPTLEALEGSSILAALKKDEQLNFLFSANSEPLPCPCKANKCLRFGLLTVLLTLYKSATLTRCEWKRIQSEIMQQFQRNLSEPSYNPFLEIDTIVMDSLERLFKHFSMSTLPTPNDVDHLRR